MSVCQGLQWLCFMSNVRRPNHINRLNNWVFQYFNLLYLKPVQTCCWISKINLYVENWSLNNVHRILSTVAHDKSNTYYVSKVWYINVLNLVRKISNTNVLVQISIGSTYTYVWVCAFVCLFVCVYVWLPIYNYSLIQLDRLWSNLFRHIFGVWEQVEVTC